MVPNSRKLPPQTKLSRKEGESVFQLPSCLDKAGKEKPNLGSLITQLPKYLEKRTNKMIHLNRKCCSSCAPAVLEDRVEEKMGWLNTGSESKVGWLNPS